MPLYVLIGRDGPDAKALRKQHRPAHLEHLRALADAGRIPFAGPLRDESGAPCGSIIILEAESLEAARTLIARDPYLVHALFAHTTLHETLQVFPE